MAHIPLPMQTRIKWNHITVINSISFIDFTPTLYCDTSSYPQKSQNNASRRFLGDMTQVLIKKS